MANVIEPEIRYLSHNAQFEFISKFEPNLLQPYITNSPISTECNSEIQGTSEISFQNLVTMPAVMWTSFFDDNPQAKKSAFKVFKYFYPNEKTIDFLMLNYETITNYCIYCTFQKISLSVKLFYSSLSQALIDAFELHIINVCLNGLSSLINYLLCYYIKCSKNVNNSDDKEKVQNIQEILERIFIRLNDEFIKFKNVPNEDEKITKKKGSADNFKKDNECNIWSYNKQLYSGPVRLGLYQVFYSLTRLTTLIYNLSNKDSTSYFNKNYTNSTLWFQLFGDSFYKYTFTMGFCDQSTYVRGLSWILCSHILANCNIYKPWSKINCDTWMNKTLKVITLNEERISQQIDFGLGKIGIENFSILFDEFLQTATDQFSGLKLIHKNYSTLNIETTVKLVIHFIQSFAANDKSKFQIYNTFLDYCFAKINPKNIHYNSDVDLSVELYFNIAYYVLKQCFENCHKNDLNFKKIPDDNVKVMMEKIVKNINFSIRTTLDNVEKKNLLQLDSQLFLNNILFTNNIKSYHLSKCQSDEYDTGMLNEYYKIFETKLIACYHEDIFRLKNDLLLPFLAMSFHKLDHYFSPYYYYLPKKLNYLNILPISFNYDKHLITNNSHEIGLFNYYLANKHYDQIIPQEYCQTISLTNILPMIEDNVITRINELIETLSTLLNNHSSIETNYEKVYLYLLNLQYILR